MGQDDHGQARGRCDEEDRGAQIHDRQVRPEEGVAMVRKAATKVGATVRKAAKAPQEGREGAGEKDDERRVKNSSFPSCRGLQ
jgi:hypothetical protein